MSENPIYCRLGVTCQDAGYQDDAYWVWGSSVARDDAGTYHMFVSRWDRRFPFFTTWMTDCEVAHAVSESPLGPFRFQDVALAKRGAQFWDGQSCHNPKITRHGDKWLLYYMGSTHPFEPFPYGTDPNRSGKHCIVGRSNKRVGLAIADSPDGPWERFDQPILQTKPNTFYSFLTSNPSPVVHDDGSVILMFKARAYQGRDHGPMTIGLAKADHYLGPYTVTSEEPLFGPDHLGIIEDPSIWYDGSGYHMLAKDMGHSICGEHHAGILVHSDDALHWELDPSPRAYSRTVRFDNGTARTFGQAERVFPMVEGGKVNTLYFAVMDGPGGFDNGTRSWNIAIPLK